MAAGAVPLCPRGELPARRSQRRTRGGSQLAGPLSPPVEQPARLGAREKRALQDEHAVGGGPLRPQPQQRWEGLGAVVDSLQTMQQLQIMPWRRG